MPYLLNEEVDEFAKRLNAIQSAFSDMLEEPGFFPYDVGTQEYKRFRYQVMKLWKVIDDLEARKEE